MELFTITAEWIEAHATEKGGWKRRQLKQIGVPWPPPKGWKDEASGRQVGECERRVFESFKGEPPRKR